MVFICQRCNNTFELEQYLIQHLNSKHSCDGICGLCGMKFDSKHQLKHHAKKPCRPINYTNDQIENIIKKAENKESSNTIKDTTANDLNNDVVSNTYNFSLTFK